MGGAHLSYNVDDQHAIWQMDRDPLKGRTTPRVRGKGQEQHQERGVCPPTCVRTTKQSITEILERTHPLWGYRGSDRLTGLRVLHNEESPKKKSMQQKKSLLAPFQSNQKELHEGASQQPGESEGDWGALMA